MPAPDPSASNAAAAPDEGAPPPSPPTPPPPPPPRPLSLASALPFWFYLAAAVSLLALVLPHLLPSSSRPPLPPPLLGQHLAAGRVLKLDPAPGLFAISSRPAAAHAPRVLILPGLAAGSLSFRRVLPALSSRGVHAAALDLPGQGLSPTPLAAAAPKRASALREIMDRGIFHAFEHLVETGEVPYQEPADAGAGAGATPPASSPSPYAPAQAAAAVARAVEALGIVGPVHLVLHDSALAAGAAFASANPGMVRSVTLVDAAVSLPAFPAAVFDVPVLGRLVLRVPALFRGLVRLCCARGMGAEEAEAHRAALRGEGRVEGVVEAWKASNHSFQLGEWRHSSKEVSKLPMMVLWSGSWSDLWIDEGKKVVAALPDAKFVYHSGGRWPQEDATDEIAELIAEFVAQSEEAKSGHIEQQVV
ncbi:hypothetical protein EJB05_27163, partial [Eragrostis curvula]